MVRKDGRLQFQQQLEVKIPSFFRCPISLEVMRSPVSLCTGVTYDRASIQRWLETGHTTCPATMVPLPSTDLIPNLTLSRLIRIWSASAVGSPLRSAAKTPADLLSAVRSSPDPLPHLLALADALADPNLDESLKNNLISAADLAQTIAKFLKKTDLAEAAMRILSLLFTLNSIQASNKKILSSSLLADLDGLLLSIIAILKMGTIDSRIDAARVLYAVLVYSKSDSKILEEAEMMEQVIRLIDEGDDGAVEPAISCLMEMSGDRRTRIRMVRAGIVPTLARVLAGNSNSTAAEGAMRVMEAVAGCSEGRAAICEDAEKVVGAVVGRMMKVRGEGREAAVRVLWAVCHAARDPRARAAVAGASGGLAKILLLMQGDCSPAVRLMSGDLLRVFRVDPKCGIGAYDTKTTHIMPF